MFASVCVPGVCRRCIMAGSIRESACVTQQITPAWSRLGKKRDRARTPETWLLASAALILPDRNTVERKFLLEMIFFNRLLNAAVKGTVEENSKSSRHNKGERT